MSILRSASPALVSFLASLPPGWRGGADLFQFTLSDRVTNYCWTSWDVDLFYDGQTYASKAPWLTRSKWNLANTMEVPSLDIVMSAGGAGFGSGGPIQQQIHDGLFDGATFLLSRAYMQTPGDTAALGALALFGGVVGQCVIADSKITITAKGKNNLLDQMAPRRVYQTTCNHAFCDAGCTLSAAAFTAAYTVGAGATAIFLPWAGAAPANPQNYTFGVVTFTGGVCAGQQASIALGTSAGLFLAYPLYAVPAAGDSFTAFQGCDKTYDGGAAGPTTQSCTARGNTQHYDGFDFVPPPDTSY